MGTGTQSGETLGGESAGRSGGSQRRCPCPGGRWWCSLWGTPGQEAGKDDEQTVRQDSVSCPNMGFTPDQALHMSSIPHGPHLHHHHCPSSLGPEALPLCGYPLMGTPPLLKTSTLAPLPGIPRSAPQPCWGYQSLKIQLKAVVAVLPREMHARTHTHTPLIQRLADGQRPLRGYWALNTWS